MNHQVLIIGAGPAGLMAAEALSQQGASVVIAEAKPSVGRKLLMAGKSGLNITKDESKDTFTNAFAPHQATMTPLLADWAAEETMAWADGLGQTLFTGTSGRVFPKAMKASPLLRAWLSRLTESDVTIRTKWRWTGWDGCD